MKKKLDLAFNDVITNKTVKCVMNKWVGPPIFHNYDYYCAYVEMIHDYWRDSYLHTPLAHIAS